MRFSHPFLLVTPLIFALFSCSSSTSKIKETFSFSDSNHETYAQISGTDFKGKLSYDNKQAYFESCNNDIKYKITNNNNLHRIYKTITDTQEQTGSVYVEFSGEINFSKRSNSNYPVTIQVEKIHHMAAEKVSLQCVKSTDKFDFKAKGEAPYWRINTYNNQLFFAAKASNELYQLKDIDAHITKENNFQGVNKKGETLFVETIPKHCYMLDNKEYWGLSTRINNIYGEFNGCGESKHSNKIELFKGKYSDEAKGINLTLNQDYTFEYLQTNDQQVNVKTGFWKSNTPEVIVLMLTTENNKKIQEEIILTGDGTIFFGEKINKKNIITQLEKKLRFEKKVLQQTQLNNTQEAQIKRQFIAQMINPKKTIDLEVKAALKKYFRIHKTDPKKTQFSSVRFDLNGDGNDDAIVLLDWCAGNQCEMVIFEANDNGLKFSSRVSRIQAPIIISKSQHFSWQSLLVKKTNSWSLLNFDGLSYPLHSSDAQNIKEIENSAEITLFSKGKPSQWFFIK